LSQRANADDREEAAAAVAFFAVAEELADIAGGAEVGDIDIFFWDARFEELELVGFGKIEDHVFRRRLMTRGHHVEPLERVGLVAGAELVEKFASVGEFGAEL